MLARISSRLNEVELGMPTVRPYLAQDLLKLAQAFEHKELPAMGTLLSLWDMSEYESLLAHYGFDTPMSLSMLDRNQPMMPNILLGPRLKILYIAVLMHCLDCSG